MRPINKPGAPNPWPPQATLTFAGANATAMDACLGGHVNVPVANCLNLWLDQVKGTAVGPPCAAERARAVTAIKNRIGDLYKQASVPLTQGLGPFCSFCETPLPGLLEVEHAVPKAEYPTYSLSWQNFLLACGPCNNAKGNTPSRATVQGWLGNPNPTEQEYYDEIRGVDEHYVWPDLDSLSYGELLPALEYFDTGSGTWVEARMDHAANLNNFILSVDIATRTVNARIFAPDNASYADVQVRVVIDGIESWATEMIALCGFNNVVNPASTYDRRMLNRTQAWFTCLAALQRLSQATSQQMFDVLWQSVLIHSVAVGFYSVWLTIMDFIRADMATAFVAQTNVPNYFPNTNTTDLP